MLEELRIVGLGVIEESVLELGPGFTAITGETGAGKTMVVSALGLLLGGRADSGAVRTGSRHARVEGVLDLRESPSARTVVESTVDEAGGMLEDGHLVLARQVSVEGRSRGYAGGAGVPANLLADLADHLVAVHGQSDQHRLLTSTAQRDALDRFAGREVMDLRERFGAAYTALRAVEEELADITAHERQRAREVDLLRFGLAEIERVAPQTGEDVVLAQEEERLGFADSLRLAAEQARETLSSEQGQPDALGAVSAARRLLDGVREHDPQAAALADRLTELSYLLGDLAADVASYASDLETDPVRLAAVSERRAVLSGLLRKYGDDLEQVLAWAHDAAARLASLDGADQRLELLQARRASLLGELGELGEELSRRRASAATELATAVTAELTALAMPHARLEVGVSQRDDDGGLEVASRRVRLSATGVDEVDLLLAANTGSEPRPLHKGASGGELSRVMLALEVVLAGSGPVPTFVFDEVDAGVGGKAAVEVGRRLAKLARRAQVVVVTHLPQVAAFADRHVVVAKSSDGTVTTSGLTVLDDSGRVRELSRMLAGLEGSGTAQAHAQELLDAARGLSSPNGDQGRGTMARS
jgi:DNA repair protein RecN (Recombination protein N)